MDWAVTYRQGVFERENWAVVVHKVESHRCLLQLERLLLSVRLSLAGLLSSHGYGQFPLRQTFPGIIQNLPRVMGMGFRVHVCVLCRPHHLKHALTFAPWSSV